MKILPITGILAQAQVRSFVVDPEVLVDDVNLIYSNMLMLASGYVVTI